MRARIVAASISLLMLATVLATPAQADATCTPYRGIGGSKWRACVNPEGAPDCAAWSESWGSFGYMRVCYGVPSGVVDPDLFEPHFATHCTDWLGGGEAWTRYCVDPDGSCLAYYERWVRDEYTRHCYA